MKSAGRALVRTQALSDVFVAPAAGFGAEVVQDSEAGGAEQPAAEHGFAGNAGGLLGQGDEHRLRNLLGRIGVAGLA